MVFGPAPDSIAATPESIMGQAAAAPFRGAPELGGLYIPDVVGENIQQGFLSGGLGLGAIVHDLTTPIGNTSVDKTIGSIPGIGEAYENVRNAIGGVRNFLNTGDPLQQQPSMTAAEYKASPYYRDDIPYDPGMTADRAAALAQFSDTRRVRAYFSEGHPFASNIGTFVGQALDPINYVPGFSEATGAAVAARFGTSFLGKMGASALLGASTAVINTAAFGALTAGLRGSLGEDTSWEAMLNEIGMSALIGGGIGAVGSIAGSAVGAAARSIERKAVARQALDDLRERGALSNAEVAQAARPPINDAIGTLANDGEVNLSPNSIAAVQKMADDIANRRAADAELDHVTASVPAGAKTVTTSQGSKVEVRPEIVDAEHLTPAEGALQVRNRNGSIVSDAQIEQIAANLDPARLMPNGTADQGAPVVGPDGIVDSGNGRVQAIVRASQAYPEKYQAYKEALRAAGYEVPDTGTPILVQRRVTELSPEARAKFNLEANMPAVATLNPLERAIMDRAALDGGTMDAHVPEASLTSRKNDTFVQRFMARLAPNERSAMVDKNGRLNVEGKNRIENALMAKAFGDVDEAVVSKFAEATDDNTRSIVGAMSDVAPRWIAMREAIKRGDIDGSLDLTPSLTEAVRWLSRWREQAAAEGRAVSVVIREGMAQGDMLGGGISLEARAAIEAMYANNHFAQAVGREAFAGRLNAMIDEVEALSQPQLFGKPEVGSLEVWRGALKKGDEDGSGAVSTADSDDPGIEIGAGRPVDEGGAGDRPEAESGAELDLAAGDDAAGTDGRGTGNAGVSAEPQPGVPGAPGREADGSLQGLPRKVGGFFASTYQAGQRVAANYMAKAGLRYRPPNTYVKVDPVRAGRIANAFEAMKHDPANPEVKAAYAAMIKETLAQYEAMLADGVKLEFAPKGTDPYGNNPRNMTEDVRANKHMWVFSTEDGFGSDATFDPLDNPLLAPTPHMISGRVALANDIFRAVHDYFGHVKEGVGFRADGEENAWRSHSAMYSPAARRAMTTETRGQNSWVNYGPYGETNRTAKSGDTHYADQKIGLLPDWVVSDGAGDGRWSNGSIGTEMALRFQEAGRPADEAKAAGDLIDAFYAQQARAQGITPEEMVARYGLPAVERGGALSPEALAQRGAPVPDLSEWPLGKLSTWIAKRIGATKSGEGMNYARLSGDDKKRSRYYRLPDGRELRVSDHDSRAQNHSDIDVVVDDDEGLVSIYPSKTAEEPVEFRLDAGGGWRVPEGMTFEEASSQQKLVPFDPGFGGDRQAWSNAIAQYLDNIVGGKKPLPPNALMQSARVALDSIRSLAAVKKAIDENKTVFIRWSAGPKYDMKPGARSMNHASRTMESALSGMEITSKMDPGEIIGALRDYAFLRQAKAGTRGHLYAGEAVGTGADGEPTFRPSQYLGTLSPEIAERLDDLKQWASLKYERDTNLAGAEAIRRAGGLEAWKKAHNLEGFIVDSAEARDAKAAAADAAMSALNLSPRILFQQSAEREAAPAIAKFAAMRDTIKAADKALGGEAAEAVSRFIGHGPEPVDDSGIMYAHQMEAIARGEAPEAAAALEKAFAPVREKLRAEFGDTVPLYRVQSAVAPPDPNVRSGSVPNDGRRAALSWTVDPKFAKAYAGVRKPMHVYSEAEIAGFERTLNETGSVTIGHHVLRREASEFSPGETVINLYNRDGEYITDSYGARYEAENENEWARESNARNKSRELPIIAANVPLDDVLWVTDRAGQSEFIVRNDPALDHHIGGDGLPTRGARRADPSTLFQPAYHGSPHLFDRFSTEHIGRGEGAQAYGHGLYFASQKDVANWYRNTLRTGTPNPEWVRLNDEYRRAQDALDTLNGRMIDETIAAGATGRRDDIAPSADVLTRHRQEWDALTAKSHDIFVRLENTSATNPGRLYHVDVPDPHELMDWDKPLAEQSPEVKAGLAKLGIMSRDLPSKWEAVGADARNKAHLRDQYGAMIVDHGGWFSAFDAKGTHLGDPKKLDKAKQLVADQMAYEQGLTGEDIYHMVGLQLSDPLRPAADFRAARQQQAVMASAALREAGIPGHQYIGHESQSTNYVIYDDSRVNIRDFEQSTPGTGPRGAITFDENGASTIHLFDHADPSTAVHEAGHHFLTMFKSMAEHPDAPAQMRDDWNAVKAWWGENADAVAKDSAASGVTADDVRAVLATGTTGDRVKDLGVNVGLQEQWARAFESYLRDGVSPTEGLRRAFEQFKTWLASVYKSALSLNVKVTPEMRGVFDRMLGGTGNGPDRIAALKVGRPVDMKAVPAEEYAGTWNAFIRSQPERSLDELMAVAPAHQEALAEEAQKLADATGATFKNPGLKKAATTAQKMVRKGYDSTQRITDVVRGGFIVATPGQADEIAAGLAKRFKIVDEGWKMDAVGYFDRKLSVQFADGTIGEVQFWHPDMLKAKSGGGHKLYEEARVLPPNDPRGIVLHQQMRDIYRASMKDADEAWKPLISQLDREAGGGGASGNMRANTSGETGSPESNTSKGSTVRQPDVGEITAAAENPLSRSTMAGRPSQLKNSRVIDPDIGAKLDTSKPGAPVVDGSPAMRPAPPEGLAEAQAAVGKGESMKDMANDLGVGLTDGDYLERPEIEQLRSQGRINAAGEEELRAADAEYTRAEAYANAIKAAANCIL